MSARASIAGLAFAAGAACGSSDLTLVGPFPPDVAYVGALLLDGEGRLVGATGLVPYRDGEGARARVRDPGAEEVRVYGWTAAQLEPLLPVDPKRLDEPLVLAEPGRATLPEPAWSGRSAPPGSRLEDAPADLAASAPWLPVCPRVVGPGEELLVDLRCGARSCPVRFDQSDCQIVLPLAACGVQDLEGAVDARGGVTLDSPQPGERCSPLTPPPLALASAACAACQVDLYRRPRVVESLAGVERVPLAPPVVGAPLRSPPYPGRLTGLALGSDRRALAAIASEEGCPRGAGPEIAVLDVDTLAVLGRERPTPGCGAALLAPAGDGAALVVETSSGAHLARLDPEGRVLAAGLIALPESAPLLGAVADPGVDRVAVLFGETESAPGRLHLHRLSDLEPVAQSGPLGEAPGGLAFAFGSRILIAGEDFVFVLRATDATFEGSIVPGTGEAVNNNFHRFAPLGSGELLGIAGGNRSGVHIFAEGAVAGATYFYPIDVAVADAVARPGAWYPSHPVLVSGFEPRREDPVGYLFRLSPREIRFAPIARRLGLGPALDLALDGAGRLWARLPLEGTVVRIPALAL